MENYNQNLGTNLKDCDFKDKGDRGYYSLNLDKARIIIVASILIGLVAVSFLIGMKYSDSSKNDDIFAGKDYPRDKNIESSKNMDNMLLNESNLEKETTSPVETAALPEKQNTVIPKTQQDILQNSTGNQIVQPVKANPVADGAKLGSNTKKAKKADAKKSETKEASSSKKKASESKVTAVSGSSKEDESEPATSKKKSGYSIQIGSFDSMEKAKQEIGKIKSMDMDSYVDKATVDGTKYYRVKVGPFATKKKALSVYEELQDNSDYENSFITKE